MPQRRRKVHKSKRRGGETGGIHKRLSMKHKTLDLDQIVDAINKGQITPSGEARTKLPLDEDKPGFGQFYCGVCDKHFIALEVCNAPGNRDILAGLPAGLQR